VKKKDWRIQYPLDGEARVPDDLDKELVDIHLLPVGSKKFWSADRIEKFIRDTAEKSKEQVRLEGKPQEIDFSRYIKDWAVQYGFSAQQAKAGIDKWVAETDKKNDPYQLGLAASPRRILARREGCSRNQLETRSSWRGRRRRKLNASPRRPGAITGWRVMPTRIIISSTRHLLLMNQHANSSRKKMNLVSGAISPI
jgi:hypothetical protein